MSDIVDLLGAEGVLAQYVQGFAPRPQQQHLARAVAETLQQFSVLVAEVGTGTGKTYAYVLPALLSGHKIIISTGTRNLQEQLYSQDLPLVRRALGVPLNLALLKGRSNYLCRYRLQQAAAQTYSHREQAVYVAAIADWAQRTHDGDIAEVVEVPEDAPIWPQVTSTADNCLGGQCPFFDECFVFKARRKALAADVVVVNHYLLCADLTLKEEGFGELLPNAQAVIIDEAHQLPEVAGQFFGATLSSRQLQELAYDCQVEQQREAPDFTDLLHLSQALEQASRVLHPALGNAPNRAPWPHLPDAPALHEAVQQLATALSALEQALQAGAQRGTGLAHCLERCRLLQQRLQQFIAAEGDNCVYWFETRPRSFTLYLTPLDISTAFRQRMQRQPSAWIFTSATLAVGEDFSHFSQRLGLEAPRTLRLESPFDYARNALLYHPQNLPDPAASHYTTAVLEATLPVLQVSRGRAFILFTSHYALREAAAWLHSRIDFPLLVQGERPKTVLLDEFRALGNAVLLATASFWEGVDVRGDALSLVVIVKLPFSSPGDPVMQARIDAVRQAGGNPFIDYQLPQAVIALKQGVGRLIRDVTDRGVLMLADPRLLTRSYGRVFLDSLPPMTRTRSLRRVEQFFASST